MINDQPNQFAGSFDPRRVGKKSAGAIQQSIASARMPSVVAKNPAAATLPANFHSNAKTASATTAAAASMKRNP